MARRSHTTELGCIACDDLADFGAGKEGWLVDNANILCALDTLLLALANQSLVLIVPWAPDGDPVPPTVKIRPGISSIDRETITAIEWIGYDDIRVLAIGTSSGYLMIYSVMGDLIHKQMIYHRRILKLRVRGTKRDQTQDIAEEVCVIMPGVVARIDGSDIQNMLQHSEGADPQSWDTNSRKRDEEDYEESHKTLPYQIWNISKYGPCADAAITGIMPPPLMELEAVKSTLLLCSHCWV